MNHPIENLMQTSMTQIKELADVNTVIGEPIITADGTMILPVSKVCIGLMVGGGEYSAMTSTKKSAVDAELNDKYPFAGVSAVGMGLTPLSFLAVQNGTVRVLPAKQDCASERIIDLIPQTISTVEKIVHEMMQNNCEKQKNKRSCGMRSRVDYAERPFSNNMTDTDSASKESNNTERDANVAE